MADPPSFFVTSLAGKKSNPMIPDAFYSTHLKGKNELKKLKLTSDAFEKTWEIKLNGQRFAGGWEDFSAAHCFQHDDVLVFRHDGDMFFHVTPSLRRSFPRKQPYISSSSCDSDDDDDDDEDDDDDDDYDDDSKSISLKKKSRLQEESSSSEKSCLLTVTHSNLRLNRICLSKKFTRRNGLNKRWCEIDVMNQSGKSWVLGLRHNNITGQDLIRGGWRSFCRANKLKPGSSYRFKLVLNGTRPLLQLCSDITPQVKANVSAKSSTSEGQSHASLKQNKFLTLTLKPFMLKSRQLRIPRGFARENEIKKVGEITLVDKYAVQWPSYLASANEQGDFYISKGWLSFCVANGLKNGETFTLEVVRGEDTTLMFKFCSKAKVKHETRVQKRARVYDGEASRRTGASNKSSADPTNLQSKQPFRPCSVSDQVTKVKQSVVDTLTSVRMFRSELEINEQKLEATLQEIDALGEKVLKINKILK